MVGGTLGAVGLRPARAQSFPSKPVRLLVGYPAGGGVDAIARLLATGLSAKFGQQVIVENRAGAAGMIAAEAVSKSAADGHTLLVGETGMLITRLLRPEHGIDPLKALAPVAGLYVLPLIIVANNQVPIRDPRTLIAELKANPGKFSYATPGIGTVQHLGFELLKAQTGTFVVHVPYRGASQILPDVIGGQIPLGVVTVTAGLSQAKAGKLRAVAMLSPVRLPGAESVPALADAVPGFNVAPRLALLGPVGMPAALIEQIGQAVQGVLSAAETVQSALQLGAVAAYAPAAELGKDLARESASWAQVIRDRKITSE
jgi:tripartite-type tricarboxylate transporter receptor subunit TctC